MKKILSILIIITTLFSLCSCKGPISDDEAQKIAKELIEKEIILTAHVYGDAFKLANPSEYEQHKDDTVFYYAKVSEKSVYTTKKQLEDAISEIYTEKVASEINEFAFTGSSGTNGVSIIARFYQPKDEDRLRIDVTSFGVYKLSAVVDLDTLVVKRSTRSMMEVTMDYRVGASDKVREMVVTLRQEDGKWRLDSRTFAAEIE